MIDNFSLLVTTAMVIFIVFRAVKLDRMLPWFDLTASETPKAKTAKAQPSRGWEAVRAGDRSVPASVGSPHSRLN